MASTDLLRRVASALSTVTNPETGKDLVLSGVIKELREEGEGRVRFKMLLAPGGAGELVDHARQAVELVPGVTHVEVEVQRPEGMSGAGPRRRLPVHGASPAAAGPGSGERAAGQATRRSLPVLGARAPAARGAGRPGAAPGPGPRPSAAPPTPEVLPGVRHVIAVSSGKGGVGKSTVSTNLAVALSKTGRRVGLMDADVYGPNIPLMFGVRDKPRVQGERVIPLEVHSVKLMSMGFLIDADTPAIWRGPIVMGVLRQFLQQVEWGELDHLIVDMPPGTGDAQLSLVQLVKVSGALLVTTPQDVSVGDVLKAIRMFERVEVPVLGVVENMSGFACPHCGERTDLFGSGGGRRLAERAGVPFLGEVPLGASVVAAGDRGRPTVMDAPDSPEAEAFRAVAEKVAAALEAHASEGGRAR